MKLSKRKLQAIASIAVLGAGGIIFLKAYSINNVDRGGVGGGEGHASIEKENSAATINAAVSEKKLSIDANKCIGCGKCERIDPGSFSVDASSRKAAVISQGSAGGASAQRAISSCPTNAING